MREFRSVEAAKICNVSLRCLQWWDEHGLVSPSREGHSRLYRAEDLVFVCLVAEFRRKGLSLHTVRRVFALIAKGVTAEIDSAWKSDDCSYLVIEECPRLRVQWERRAGVIEAMKRARGPVLLVCLTDIAKTIAERARNHKERLVMAQCRRVAG